MVTVAVRLLQPLCDPISFARKLAVGMTQWRSHNSKTSVRITQKASVGGQQEHREGERGEEGGEDEEADGEDELPSDYSADGVLTATLQTFADLRVISEPHAPAAVRPAAESSHGNGALLCAADGADASTMVPW